MRPSPRPPAHDERIGDARRSAHGLVELARAGVRLHPRRLTPARLTDAVRTAIELRAGARRVSRAYAAAGGAAAAADAIEAIADGRRPPATSKPLSADLDHP
ncbi:MAG TPA: hypothetical protein VNY27_11610 [Solirubrobacteraceae bacterium]|nr:hypothetical protein [Solirubrobacteraceae bacterium]